MSVMPAVPTTDAEVESRIEQDFSGVLLQRTLLVLYRCHRVLGDNVLEAWKKTMEDFITAYDLGQQPHSEAGGAK